MSKEIFYGKEDFRSSLEKWPPHSFYVASHAQSVLKRLIHENFPSMAAFAEKSGVTQSVVWRDCHGRGISDRRFASYLHALDTDGQEQLLRARLRDLVPTDFTSWVQVSPPRIAETPLPSTSDLLPRKTRQALDRLADEMGQDPELHDWILQLVRRVC